jgi:hypothetical protein
MKTITIPETTFESLIEDLESAINVCNNVDYQSDEPEKSAPYATGYCRSAMKQIVEELQQIKSQAN